MKRIGKRNYFTGLLSVLIALTCVLSSAEDATPSYDSLVRAVTDAEKEFNSLSSQDSPEAVVAMRSVIACRRALLTHLIGENKDENAEAIRREFGTLTRSVAWVAAQCEKRKQFENGQAEWASLAECCKKAFGSDCPEYWDAIQEANAFGRLANASPQAIVDYLENRSKREKAVGSKDWETAHELAIKDHELCSALFGELVPRTIKSLEFVASVTFNRGKFIQAFDLLEDALKQRHDLFPAWHTGIVQSKRYLFARYQDVYRLAKNYQGAGHHDYALNLYEEVFTRCGATIDENNPLRGFAGQASGEIFLNSGKHREALKRLSTSAQIWKSHSNTKQSAYCLRLIGLIQQHLGEHVAAESTFQEAARLSKSHNGDENVRLLEVKIAANYAALLEETGRFLEALQIFEGIIEQKKSEPEFRAAVDSSGENIEAKYATLLEKTGRFPEALKIYEEMIDGITGDTNLSPADISACENLALLYQSVGELAKAETLFDSLLQYSQRQPLEIAQLLSNRGRFYLQVGALDKADQELDAALTQLNSAAKDMSAEKATIEGLKAHVLLERGRAAEALDKYQAVLQTRLAARGPKHVECAEVYDQIAKVQRKLGRYSDAIATHLKAIGVYEAVYGTGHYAVAWAYHRLGTTHFLFDEPDEACKAWRKSFQIKQDICQQTLPWLTEAQASAFLTSLTTNDSSAGRDTLLSTLIVDKSRNAEEAFQCVWRSRGLVLNAIASRERQSANMKQSPERAQLAKIRSRLAQLSIQGDSEDSARKAARAAVLRELNDQKEALERIIAERAQAGNIRDDADALLCDVTPSDLMNRLPAQTAVVQLVRTERWHPAKQNANEVIKELVYDAFVVTKNSSAEDTADASGLQVQWVELGDALQIDSHIAKWRKAILIGEGGTRGRRVGKRAPKPDSKISALSREVLYQQVWQPIANALGSNSRVVMIPDGDFHRLPWVALPGAKADYLIEEIQITTAADGRQLAQLLKSRQATESAATNRTPARPPSESFLLIGGVEYNAELPAPEDGFERQARDTTWAFLKGTREEVAAIGKVLPPEQTRQLLGEDAMEEVIKEEFERADIIHIATHGYFADDIDEDLTNDETRGAESGPRHTTNRLAARNPLLQCGLTLAGCNCDVWLDANGLPIDCGQDGYLSAEEIMGMDLATARLVVLSACETGLGSIGNGEGVFGLQRALHISGVQSTIASGWKVDDRATQILMTEMYRQMFSEGLSPADALHAAQLRILRQFNRDTGQLEDDASKPAPPYYWAAFSLSGAF